MVKIERFNESLGFDLSEYDHNYDIHGYVIRHADGEFLKNYKDTGRQSLPLNMMQLESKTNFVQYAKVFDNEEEAQQISRYLESEKNLPNEIVKASDILVAVYHVEYATRLSDTEITIGIFDKEKARGIQEEVEKAQGSYGPTMFLTLKEAQEATIDFCEMMIVDMQSDIKNLQKITVDKLTRNNRWFKPYSDK